MVVLEKQNSSLTQRSFSRSFLKEKAMSSASLWSQASHTSHKPSRPSLLSRVSKQSPRPRRPSISSGGSAHSSPFYITRRSRRLHSPDLYGRCTFDHIKQLNKTYTCSSLGSDDMGEAVRTELQYFKDTLTHETISPMIDEIKSVKDILRQLQADVAMAVPPEVSRSRPEKSCIVPPSFARRQAACECEAKNADAHGECVLPIDINLLSRPKQVGFAEQKLASTSEISLPDPEGRAAEEDHVIDETVFPPRRVEVQASSEKESESEAGSEVGSKSGNLASDNRGSDNRGPIRRSATWGLSKKGVLSWCHGNQKRGAIPTMVWKLVEDPESGMLAWMYGRVMFGLIFLSVIAIFLQMGQDAILGELAGYRINLFFDTVFAFELFIRFVCCPNRFVFCINPYSIIDLIACVVASWFHISVLSGATPHDYFGRSPESLMHCLRIITRMLKLVGRFQNFHLMLSATVLLHEALLFHFFLMLTIAICFSMVIFLVEPPGSITIPEALWFTIVTMTTVGYGDITTSSTAGRFISGVLMIVSTFYMAVPVGIVGNVFSRLWDERFRLLLMRKARDFIIKSGYAAQDLPMFFQSYGNGQNEDGEVDFDGFNQMLSDMKIGLDDNRVEDLFNLLDGDGSGTVADDEFIRVLFPNQFRAIYGKTRGYKR